MTAAAIEFNEQLIKEKGKEFAKLLGMQENEMQFSNGWVQKFKKRNQLHVYRLYGGEASSVSTEQAEKIISQFDPADVYNADETGLFFSYVTKSNDCKTSKCGGKLV